jgi:hypothetical protein
VPLYAARIEDLGPGDFVVDCMAHRTALLAPAFLVRLGWRGGIRSLTGRVGSSVGGSWHSKSGIVRKIDSVKLSAGLLGRVHDPAHLG